LDTEPNECKTSDELSEIQQIFKPFKEEAQVVLFKDPVRTAL
jgi:hypothetical protein